MGQQKAVSDTPVVLLGDASGTRLEYRQVHKPFSISKKLVISVFHEVLLFP